MTALIIIGSYLLMGCLFIFVVDKYDALYSVHHHDPADTAFLFLFWPIFVVCFSIVFISDRRYDGWVKKRIKKINTGDRIVIPSSEIVVVSCYYGTGDVFYIFTGKHAVYGVLKHEHDYKREVIIGEHEKEKAREIWKQLIDEGFVEV